MLTINENYMKLSSSYLFYNIELRVKEFEKKHKDAHLLRLGVGDVTLPLCDEVIKALRGAVEDQSKKETFHGYMPECGADFLKDAIRGYYLRRNMEFTSDEIFISSGAGDELGAILDLFSKNNTTLIVEPTYPAYLDTNIMAGHKIVFCPANIENNFTPPPPKDVRADIIYICSPNNPTGAVYNKEQLKEWVDYANEHKSVIIFDAAYEAFIEDEDVPHSIFEIEGSRTCAIEICSLSKTAGFTGTRLGYTIMPKSLEFCGQSLNAMWVRNRTTKTNGVSYIVQRGGEAVFSDKGRQQIMENIAVYKNNGRVLTKAFDECGIWYCGGKNAPYIWFKCPNGMGSWECFDYLLNNASIIGTPGEGFGEAGEGFFRFSTFGDTEDTKTAAKRLVELFKK